MRIAAALLAALPALALAQGGPPPGRPPHPGVAGPPPSAAAGAPDAPPPGTGAAAGKEPWGPRMEKRMRLARALGLAEALDLEPAQVARMDEVLKGFDARRKPVLEKLRADAKALRGAAGDAKATAKQVDDLVARMFAERGQMMALDQEMYAAVGKDLSPEKRARMALFFARFRARMGEELRDRHEWRGRGPGPGPGGRRMEAPLPPGMPFPAPPEWPEE
jgi:hypothetical protein